MTTAVTKIDLVDHFFDDNGSQLANGFVYTYVAQTNTPLATYSDYLGNAAHSNPIELDSSGLTQIWFLKGYSYKVHFEDEDHNTVGVDIDGLTIPDDGSATSATTASIIATYPAGPPGSSQWIGGESFAEAVSFPANFAGSQGKTPQTDPTSSFAVDIQKNGTTCGTATCATNGTWTFTTAGGAVIDFAVGDEIDYFAPSSADATMADFGFTLLATLA